MDSKFLVGLGGILVVACSVLASMGFYSWIGIPSSLVILQVVPFLVLAVGADNIFIFVLEYQVLLHSVLLKYCHFSKIVPFLISLSSFLSERCAEAWRDATGADRSCPWIRGSQHAPVQSF